MLTLSLDEAGVFEHYAKEKFSDSKTKFIGGLIYDDNGIAGETEKEKRRIVAYYSAVIDTLNNQEEGIFRFPNDIHSDGKNNRKVGNAKELINNTLQEFIQAGTFQAKELIDSNGNTFETRKGKYIVCAVVKSTKGKTSEFETGDDSFFNDTKAANLYYHMASEVVEHFIIRNPLYPKISDLSIDVATRESKPFDKKNAEYMELGFSERERIVEKQNMWDEELPDKGTSDKKSKEYSYALMNGDIFRTILTEQLFDAREKSINICDFKVRSITYRSNRAKSQAFLYLADSICSYLSCQNRDDVSMVFSLANELNPGQNLIFVYDDIDIYFKRAWQDVEIKEYYDALKELYKIKIAKTKEAKIYKDYWIKYIEDEIIKEITIHLSARKDPHALVEALQELRTSYMTNMLVPDEAQYIFKVLERATREIKDEKKYSKILYQLNDVGVVSNCHSGDIKAAVKYFKCCEKYAFSIDLEEYIRTRNRYCNALIDSFDYEDAIKVARVTVELAGGLYELSKKVLGNRRKGQFGKTEYGKTLSQIGQIAAFLQKEDALGFFNDALDLLQDEIANTKITESYKLHYLIDCGKKEEYKLAMVDYNDGVESISNQIKTMRLNWSSENINISFALYMYLKGIDRFYSDEELMTVWEDIKCLESEIDDNRKNNHPWELIYKYLGFIAIRMHDMELATKYINKVSQFVEDDKANIISALAFFSMAELMEKMGNEPDSRMKYDELYTYLENNFPLFNPEKIELNDYESKKGYLQTRFTYMYC